MLKKTETDIVARTESAYWVSKKDFERVIENAWYDPQILPNHSNQYYLVLTNDVDSLVSCKYLNEKFGIPIGGFFDFETWLEDSSITKGKQPIFVDCDLKYGKCFGNHASIFYNRECFNLNNWENEYRGKFAGSTIITLLGLYESEVKEHIPQNKLLFYLLIDGFYSQYFYWKFSWAYWTNFIGFQELNDVVKKYSKKELDNLNSMYMLTKKIKVYNNKLYWGGGCQRNLSKIWYRFNITTD